MKTHWVKYFVTLVCIALAASTKTTNDTSLENCVPKATWSVYMEVAAEMIAKAKSSFISCHDVDGKCEQTEALMSYLEVIDDVIHQAKINFPTCDNCNKMQHQIRDCSDLLRMGHRRSGVYAVSPLKTLTEKKDFDVYCDMETDGGGWTVIQRRGDFQNPVDYFYKDWKSYKEGFGDVEKEFWIGNDNIFALTNQGNYSVRFDLKDYENNTRYAQYESFWIDEESTKYTLHISNYSGDAGIGMEHHDNQKFSTRDQDNDGREDYHCAQTFKGGWWFNYCYHAHLNGEKLKGEHGWRGIVWRYWKQYESLASTEIKIRPKNFRA